MNKLNIATVLLAFLFLIHDINAQEYHSEVGLGIGNVLGEEHSLGKSELFFNVIKSFNFGQLGLDFSTGGNLIPGDRSTVDLNIETLSPNDVRFGSIMIVYRYPIKKHLFIEPRLGYSSLSYFVHTDDDTKISEHNFSIGLGLGATLLDKLSLSFRYQYLGVTPEYEGTKDRTTVISHSESVDLMIFRIAYRFNWGSIFKP